MTAVCASSPAEAPGLVEVDAGLPPLLRANLSVDYPGKPGVLRNVEFSIAAGEVLGLVGVSGAGKSTIAQTILQTVQLRGGKVRGELLFDGRDLLREGEAWRRRVRGSRIALIPQSPLSSLNPALTLRSQFREAWQAHSDTPFNRALPRVFELLRQVSLPGTEEFIGGYPSSLSVGLAQRVLIAMAMLHSPPLVIADEPTSALDVITQAEILRLFRSLNESTGMAMLYVSHDLLSVSQLCHRVAVLYQGSIVEMGPASRIFRYPEHEYTRRLVDSIPRVDLTLPDAEWTGPRHP